MWLKKLKNKWMIIWLASCFIVTIILLICIFFNYSLIIGWILGLVLALTNCSVNKKISRKSLNKNKRLAFWRGIIKANIFWLISFALLFSIIMINKYFQNVPFFKNDLKVAFSPINIFTFLIGFTYGQMYQLNELIKPSELKDAKDYW